MSFSVIDLDRKPVIWNKYSSMEVYFTESIYPTLTISKSNAYHQGYWVMTYEPWFENKRLKASLDNVEAAQEEALGFVREQLEKTLSLIGGR